MKTVTLQMLEWVDEHIKALKEIEADKGQSFTTDVGIKSFEEMREKIIELSDNEYENMRFAFADSKFPSNSGKDSGKWFKQNVKSIHDGNA